MSVPHDARAGDILVSNDHADDAAVVRIEGADRALVLTADVITPLVDDPEQFGEIAATNAVSDVYAMGGRPLYALNLAFFPDDRLPLEVLRAIMRGGARACQRMGVAIVGGHTVRDAEVKYGLSVTGEVEPERVWSNRGARAGQALVLTKALGTGIVANALKQDLASEHEIAAAVASMTTPNAQAAEVARRYRVTACTDVTGFGLLGHLRNIVRGSSLDAVVHLSALPLLPGAMEHARAGRIPGGTRSNLAFIEPMLRRRGQPAGAKHANDTDDALRALITADAQTSGGLLLCVHPDDAAALVGELRAHGLPAAEIGTLRARASDADAVIELA